MGVFQQGENLQRITAAVVHQPSNACGRLLATCELRIAVHTADLPHTLQPLSPICLSIAQASHWLIPSCQRDTLPHSTLWHNTTPTVKPRLLNGAHSNPRMLGCSHVNWCLVLFSAAKMAGTFIQHNHRLLSRYHRRHTARMYGMHRCQPCQTSSACMLPPQLAAARPQTFTLLRNHLHLHASTAPMVPHAWGLCCQCVTSDHHGAHLSTCTHMYTPHSTDLLC